MADGIYSEKEAQEILRLAARRSNGEGGMSRDGLLQVAAEMGIDPAEVLAAEEEVQKRKAQTDLRSRYVDATRKEFFGSVSSFVGMSILLFGINYLTSGFQSLWSTWAIWPCGFFAIHMLGDAWEYMTAKTPIADEDFEKWIQKKQKKELEKQKAAEWKQQTPGYESSLAVARQAYVDYGPDQKLLAIKVVRERTGLGLKESKDLIDAVEDEARRASLRNAVPRPVGSIFEAARKALDEVGHDRKLEAIELLRARTGLGIRESQEAIEAVLELTR